MNQKFVKEILAATDTVNPIYDAFLMQESYVDMCSGIVFIATISIFTKNSFYFAYSFTDALNTNGFKSLLNYPDDFKFDLIIHDFTVGSCFLPFVHKFKNPPLLAVTAFGHPPFLNNLIGGHQYYAYAPHFSTAFDDQMSFAQRFLNFILHAEEMM